MSILGSVDFTKPLIEHLFKTACGEHRVENKILMNVFFEPSTRTSFSFECAMKRLGGEVINFTKETSSINKGETYEDTIRSLSCYADIMVVRHPNKDYIKRASEVSSIPIINGGNGNGEHPTQALLDLYTMYKKWGNGFETKSVLFVGDIKNSRTIHSLVSLMKNYPEMKIQYLAYDGCGPDESMLKQVSEEHGQKLEEIEINKVENYDLYDVIYCTRRQKERENGIVGEPDIIVDEEFADKLKDDAIIMHPLPRNSELCVSVDSNKRCYYFEQMKYGVEIRMSLLYYVLNIKN